MSIVKYKLSNGQIAVYESTSYYDPEKKQARPKRKYLGMEDPATGELIPSSGKRGRRSKQNSANPGETVAPSAEHNVSDECKSLKQTIRRLKDENLTLHKENEKLREEVSRCHQAIGFAVSTLGAVLR